MKNNLFNHLFCNKISVRIRWACAPDGFRHFLIRRVFKLLRFVVMRRNLQQPLALDLDHLPHELFRREHELVVQHPSRQLLEQRGVRVDHHRLVVLHRLVVSAFRQLRNVIKVAGGDGLADVHRFGYARHHVDLHTLHQVGQLEGDGNLNLKICEANFEGILPAHGHPARASWTDIG